jgi:acetoin utilization deacetylase AcuC-like enzyme
VCACVRVCVCACVRVCLSRWLLLVQTGDGVPSKCAVALTTLPGHHTTPTSFGGYCYVNHAAVAARLLQRHFGKVAVRAVTM